MARSLSKLKVQIAKLQQQADSIQSGIVTRIKREIAQHGLTAEDLFGSATADGGKTAAPARKASTAQTASVRKRSADKPAKYADGNGNSWGGIGKRPQWIHAALEAGKSIDEFLVTTSKPTAKAKTKSAAAPKRASEPRSRKAVAQKKPAKATVDAAAQTDGPAKKARKTAAPAKKAPAKTATARKSRANKAAPTSESAPQATH